MCQLYVEDININEINVLGTYLNKYKVESIVRGNQVKFRKSDYFYLLQMMRRDFFKEVIFKFSFVWLRLNFEKRKIKGILIIISYCCIDNNFF